VASFSGSHRFVLDYLAEEVLDRQPDQAIAEELVIGLDTVKRAVSHVLGKLGVVNRTQAVARAHELGLLR
jgi:ATP/maltotriose-dependent transcriptional regulator MalT